MNQEENQLHWVGRSKQDLLKWADKAAIREAGHQIHQVQNGLDPDDWKPMPSIGKGVREIRIHCDNEYRVIYLAIHGTGVYILNAFTKKTQKTPKKEIDKAKTNLAAIN